MNVLDIGVILILLMFAIVGFKQGVIRELFALVGIILIFEWYGWRYFMFDITFY